MSFGSISEQSQKTPESGTELTFQQLTIRGGHWDSLRPSQSLWMQVMYHYEGRLVPVKSNTANPKEVKSLFVRIFKDANGKKLAYMLQAKSDVASRRAEPTVVSWDGFQQTIRQASAASIFDAYGNEHPISLVVIPEPREVVMATGRKYQKRTPSLGFK